MLNPIEEEDIVTERVDTCESDQLQNDEPEPNTERDPRTVVVKSELGNTVIIPMGNEDLSVNEIDMIQETVEPFGHVFATCPQETKMVSNFEYEPEQIEDKIIYDPPNKWSPNDLPGLLKFITSSLENGTIEESCSP